MRRGWAVGALVALALCAPAWGTNYPTGWNGDNPFSCELQNVGFGTSYPHPEADPFCVEFDKRRQNVSQLGVVDFLSQEPARVAAASSNGIVTMRERAELVGGTIEFLRPRDGGTLVRLSVPVVE